MSAGGQRESRWLSRFSGPLGWLGKGDKWWPKSGGPKVSGWLAQGDPAVPMGGYQKGPLTSSVQRCPWVCHQGPEVDKGPVMP